MCLKRLSLILFLLLSPLLLSADIYLTENEYQELMQLLEISETALSRQTESIENLKEQLNKLKTLQTLSEQIISQQQKQLEQLETYYKKQKSAVIFDRLKWFGVGMVSVYVTKSILDYY
jgi:DNA repair exonuclease SbcCD ATPase subunit